MFIKESTRIIEKVFISLFMMGIVLFYSSAKGEEISFDRKKMHALAIAESLTPIRPGIPGKVPFWNRYSTSFIYAPAFDFKPVDGAASYRFTVLVYGSKSWMLEGATPKASLESVWKEMPVGKYLAKMTYQYENGKWRNSKQSGKWLEKKGGEAALILNFKEERGGGKYRIIVHVVKTCVFEADVPWAALTPVWKDVPIGWAELTVAGLDKKGGKAIALAKIGKSSTRRFERRKAFNGPYHEAAMDYTEAGMRWLRWQAKGSYAKWRKEGNPKRLGIYPCKYEVAAIEGLTALAALEGDPAMKKKYLQMARNAARTLIKGSYPADWGLAYLPPTYGSSKGYTKSVMRYPSNAGHAYLDLYEATKEKEFLDATVRIADAYKRLQLPNGSWPILMDAKTGKKTPGSKTCIMPTGTNRFLTRLIDDHGMASYQPVVDAAWKWVERDVLREFRFEGQFEDGAAGRGGEAWHVSHHMARAIALYLLQPKNVNPKRVALAEEIMRWSEDQFLFWETPPNSKKVRYTPWGEEQHSGKLEFRGKGYSTEVGGLMKGWIALYEATGKELYLAKATAMANAMTVIQKQKYGGNFVGTNWGWGKGSGGWPNCHTFCARTLLKLGRALENRKLTVAVNPEAGAKIDWATFKR